MGRRTAVPPQITPEGIVEVAGKAPLLLSPHWSGEADPGLEAVREAVRAADGPKGYLHWDKLRHRPCPPGWTPEEIWTVVRVRRDFQGRPLPDLLQKDGRPFTLVESSPYRAALQRLGQPTELWSVVRELLRLEDATAGWGKQTAVFTRVDDTYRIMAAFEEAYFSSAIEGAVTTQRQARELLRTQREPRDKSERMVLNVYRTVELLRERLEEPLRPDFIREIHATLTDGTLEDVADQGRFRGDDSVVISDSSSREVLYEPPPASELAERMDRLCAFANATNADDEFIHPITRAILLHHQLAYDHPFVDGNGRTARALFQWAVLRAGFPWFRFLSISRAIHRSRESYYRSFRYVQTDQGDLTYFVRDQLRCIEAELARFVSFLESRVRTAAWLRSKHEIEATLNDRQLALLEYALAHPTAEFSVPEHRRFHGVSQPTAYKDITSLIRAGLLHELRREGRRVIYGPTDRLVALARECPERHRR